MRLAAAALAIPALATLGLGACGGADDGRCTLPTGADSIRSAPFAVTVPPPGNWNVTVGASTPRYVIKLSFKGDQGIFASSEPHAGTYPAEHTTGCGACLEITVLGPEGRLDPYGVDAQIEASTVTMTDVTAIARDVKLTGPGLALDGCTFDEIDFASAH